MGREYGVKPRDEAYKDADGKRILLDTLCKREPEWAANNIRRLEAEVDTTTRHLNHVLEKCRFFEGALHKIADALPNVEPESDELINIARKALGMKPWEE